jgi:predicted PurR-regulated permease PerM
MEQNERYTDKLAKYIIMAAGAAIIAGLCWYFRSVLIYVLIAVVVSLIGKPVMGLLKKLKIKGRKAPDWILAALTLLVTMTIIISVVTMLFPIVSGILKGISISTLESSAGSIAVPLANLNEFLRNTFPQLGEDFRLEVVAVKELQNIFNVSTISSVIGSATSFLTSFGVGLFSVVFISFFFIN